MEDAARGTLKDVYAPVDDFGQERKPSLRPYPEIPWDKIKLDQFNLLPGVLHPLLKRVGAGWGTFRIIPVESGRGCPYGCEFCTVTGFFGDSIRFRTNESVVNELLLLKARAREEGGQIAVFFIDDNFAINVKRTKSLLRDIIAANAQVHWVAQISANLLRDEELVDLIAAAGGKWIFIGMESIDPANLADVKKGFNKPGEYARGARSAGPAQRLRDHLFYLRHGQRHSRRGGANAEGNSQLASGAADFWLDDATACDATLQKAGSRWAADASASTGRNSYPLRWRIRRLKMSIDEAHNEVRIGWANSYSPEAIEKAVDSLNHKPLGYRINILIARLCFRGIYFPQMGRFAWLKAITRKPPHNFQTDQAGVPFKASRCLDLCRNTAGYQGTLHRLAGSPRAPPNSEGMALTSQPAR